MSPPESSLDNDFRDSQTSMIVSDYNALMVRRYIFPMIDFPHRVLNKLSRTILNAESFSKDTRKSDSQITFYEKSVQDIIESDRKFNRFRRVYNYREILEHLSYGDGLKYLGELNKCYPQWRLKVEEFGLNDKVGKPRVYEYDGIGKFSPTTLRYIKVAYDLERLFGNQKISRVVEIGAGYGGQFAILQRLRKIPDYLIFDLPEVQILIAKYLGKLEIGVVQFPKFPPNEFDKSPIDLVISNYAFSELPREVQTVYLEKVCKYARNGYLIMNSGISNFTGRSDGKLRLEEIRRYIPNIQIHPEKPSTGPDNYLLYWNEVPHGQ